MHIFLYKKIGIDSQIKEEYNQKNTNYYEFCKLNYYKPDVFN